MCIVACFEVEKRKTKKKKIVVVQLNGSCSLLLVYQDLFKKYSYLPGAGDTVISKAVPPGRDSSIALGLS